MHTHTLLLVDDSSTTEQDIRSALAGEPIDIIVAGDGHSALERIEAHRVDVVLASATAQGVNGYDIAYYVSQRRRLSHVAVLLLTGNVTPADTERMKASGARGFVRLPLDPATVRANVKEVLIFPGPELGEVDVLGQLTSAFDAIDETMTSSVAAAKARPSEIPISPEVLAKIVSDAVHHALAAYEKARSQSAAPARDSRNGNGSRPAAAPASPSPRQREQQRLQREMGVTKLDEETTPTADRATDARLSAEMGIDEFTFDDAAPQTRNADPARKSHDD